MALHGEDLGAELANLWHDGTKVLPKVAGDYHTAWLNTPISISGYTTRGGGLGTDPGSAFDVSELPGRTQELLSAYHDAMMQMMAAAGAYGYVPPTDDKTSTKILGIYDDFLSIPDPDRFGWITDNLLNAMKEVAADGTSAANTGDSSITFSNKD